MTHEYLMRGAPTDEEVLEVLLRVGPKLHQVVSNAVHWGSATEKTVLTINSELQRLEDAGLNVREWIVPESELKPSKGYYDLATGRVQVRRMSYERFIENASPMLAFIDRETARRQRLSTTGGKEKSRPSSVDRSEVWVIHGRDAAFRTTIFDLLRRVRLHPIEFNEAVARSGSGSPILLDLILGEITNAPAIVSLLSPDDYANLRSELRPDPKSAKKNIQAGYQPRPNVILETGMALAALRDKTILVTKGELREISDMLGVHAVHWQDNVEKRSELVERLRWLGSPVVTSGSDWQK